MSNLSEMTDGSLNDLNSGIEQLVISNLRQETDNLIPYTNEDETSSETDTQQVASTLKSFPENKTSTSLDTMFREERQLAMNVHPTDVSFGLGAPTPSVLFANHESREEARKYYKKVRLHFGDKSSAQGGLFRTFFVNPDKDIFDCNSLRYSEQYWDFDGKCGYYYHGNDGNIVGTWMHKLFNELGTIKSAHWSCHDGLAFWGHDEVTLMPNLKRYILTTVPGIPQYILDAFACKKDQKFCIEETQSELHEENKKNPACPTPVVEFDISLRKTSSAL
ncbi:hypothetical protein BOTCAL_0258g00170 [Botryotinia calthae]|uniref:Uncharacterized protein n=1 Tax=Botryotinia calthae TaxID=38488 RepID=A0A4Y8CW98_9HELO|nr:hypothetical protein BOTCAL_0258g00170 [Botryotinia calthae]